MSEVQTLHESTGIRPYLFGVPALVSVGVPLLENGDHLTRAEFERRYDAMPELKKAELIKGVVHMASPVRHRRHSKPNRQALSLPKNVHLQVFDANLKDLWMSSKNFAPLITNILSL